MARMWENLNSRGKTTMMASRTWGLTNLSMLPSSFSTLSTQLLAFPVWALLRKICLQCYIIKFDVWSGLSTVYVFSFNTNSSWVSLMGSNLIKLEIGHLVCFSFCLVTIWNGYGQLSVNNLIQSKSFKKVEKLSNTLRGKGTKVLREKLT